MPHRSGHARLTRPRGPALLASIFVVGVSLLALSGCGYSSLVAPVSPGSGDASAAEPIRIAVDSLRSQSAEPWLDRIVGDALRRELDLRGTFRLVEDPARADLVLGGRIAPVRINSNSFSTFVVAVEYRVTLSVELEVLKRSGDVLRLGSRGLSESDVYLASADVEVSRTNRLEALRHLSDLIAVRAADSIEWLARPPTPPEPPDAGEGAAS